MARWLLILVSLVLVGSGCGTPRSAPTTTAPSSETTPAARASAPKRLVAAIRGNPISLAQRRTQPTSGSVPGLDRSRS